MSSTAEQQRVLNAVGDSGYRPEAYRQEMVAQAKQDFPELLKLAEHVYENFTRTPLNMVAIITMRAIVEEAMKKESVRKSKA